MRVSDAKTTLASPDQSMKKQEAEVKSAV